MALTIAARAHQQLDEIDQARQISSDVLAVAESVKDEGQVALAASNLASVMASLGRYPDALLLRERAEAIHRRLANTGRLPYDLTNHADLLIGLGRAAEAETLLAEVDAGVAAGIGSYVGRQRRATFLRAVAATTALRCGDARRLIAQLQAGGTAQGAAGALAAALDDFCAARLGRRGTTADAASEPEPGTARERHYWRAAAALQRRDATTALDEAVRGLTKLGTLPNDELRWRLAAVGALAARASGDTARATTLDATARRALAQVRADWKTHFDSYARRTDIADLRTRAGLT